MFDALTFAATETECDVETTMRKSYDGYRLKRDEPAVALAAAAFARCGFEPRYGLSGGGADANVFNERGRSCVNLSHGVFGFHTPDEHVSVVDLEAMVDVTVALVKAARA
jgi:tripeptide aminopeptidase